jgi:hypothetical protein
MIDFYAELFLQRFLFFSKIFLLLRRRSVRVAFGSGAMDCDASRSSCECENAAVIETNERVL